MAVRVGLTLQPEAEYLERLDVLLREEADYVEVAPETLWRRGRDGEFEPNRYHDLFRTFRDETGKPFVAHGVGLSIGTADPNDAARLATWLDRIRVDHEVFAYEWYTDHLGATTLDGRVVALPVPIPMTDEAATVVRERLAALQTVVPDVGFENAVFYFLFGRPLDEPAFFSRILTQPRMHLLLDLHNVFTMAENFDFDADAYLDGVDCSRVIEIHMAGGDESDARWLPSGRTMRLDSHCSEVPEPVWELLARVLPRCPNLRGVTLERMEGTVTSDDDVAGISRELNRIRDALSSTA